MVEQYIFLSLLQVEEVLDLIFQALDLMGIGLIFDQFAM